LKKGGVAQVRAAFSDRDIPIHKKLVVGLVLPFAGIAHLVLKTKAAVEAKRPTTPCELATFLDGDTTVPDNPTTDLVTLLANIASNIGTAIRACKEKGDIIWSRQRMQIIKESLNDGYCDVSGNLGDLKRLGEIGNVTLFCSKDVPNHRRLLKVKKDSIARFIRVLQPIRDLYRLPPTSVHIFYNLAGGTIAFNCNGSIFLNLRYFEAWHDDQVRNGELIEAYTSWYSTLAHEIAHNLVQPHNSEHELYFSLICQKFLPGLAELVQAERRRSRA